MTARIIDGKQIAARLREQLKGEVGALEMQLGRPPGLAVIRVGDDAASEVYVRNKRIAAEKVGVRAWEYALPADTSREQLLAKIGALNADDQVDGILVQLPLPSHLDEAEMVAAISPEKDVDGFHAANVGQLWQGHPQLVPCTPLGVMHLLAEIGVEPEGLHAVVIGRSQIVGKPMAALLLQSDATVTVCHSRTRDLAGICRAADIVVAAVGRPRFVQRDWIKPGAIVIDVGINRLADGGLVGDVDFDAVREVAGYITPVPGGVGPLTIAMLLANTVQAARARAQTSA